MQTTKEQLERLQMSKIQNEIKITHIHQGKDDENSFIKRFGVEVIEAFKTSTIQ